MSECTETKAEMYEDEGFAEYENMLDTVVQADAFDSSVFEEGALTNVQTFVQNHV
jgi:hypothetical protein